MSLPSIIIVTGTDTDVGKTITTAALATVLEARGLAVAVYKPCQSGAAGGASDISEVQRLAGLHRAEHGVLLAEPLAPVQAARLEGVDLPALSVHAARIAELAAGVDHVLVEGAGGLLVELDAAGGTLADLAALTGPDAGCVVVARPGLGTLNHVALTLEALTRRDLTVLGLVLGTWPEVPGPVETGNRRAFKAAPLPLLGVLPERAAVLPPAEFRRRAGDWLSGLPL